MTADSISVITSTTMASLDAVDSNGVSEEATDLMKYWRQWLGNDKDTRRQFELSLFTGMMTTVNRRDAVYIVQCLRALLPITRGKARKTTVLTLDKYNLPDDAIGVFCDFLRNASCLHNTLRLRLDCRFLPPLQIRRLLESLLHANTSLKQLELDCAFSVHAESAVRIGNLLQHKKDWTYLRFLSSSRCIPHCTHCTWSSWIDAQLRQLSFSSCDIDDDGTRLILESISSDSHGLEHFDLSYNRITSVGLRTLTVHLPVAHPKLKTLDMNDNYGLLDDKPRSQGFVDGILLSDNMALKKLNIGRRCGEYAPIIYQGLL